MKNEFGVVLDSNGYAPSIMPNKKDMFGHPQCYCCLNGHALVRHEVLYGQNRTKAKLLACGFWFARIVTGGFTAKSSAGPGWKGWMPGCGLNLKRPHSAWQ